LSSENDSYVALRVVSRSTSSAWWASARSTNHKPPAIVAMLNGRDRIEVSAGDAAATLAWASRVAGWPEAEAKPIIVHAP
jgi:hypothetical protein